jgi:hypothetical protein
MSDIDDLEEIAEQCSPRVNAPKKRHALSPSGGIVSSRYGHGGIGSGIEEQPDGIDF